MKQILTGIVMNLEQVIGKYVLWFRRVKFGKGIHLYGIPKIRNSGMISIGNHVTIQSHQRYSPTASSKNTFLYSGKDALITIRDFAGLSNVKISCRKSITIGQYAKIGSDTKIIDSNLHSLNYMNRRNIGTDTDIHAKAIEIGSDVFIGTSCIILKGVTIGDRSVIGAGSVVTKSIPPDEIWAGNPAKYISKVPTFRSEASASASVDI